MAAEPIERVRAAVAAVRRDERLRPTPARRRAAASAENPAMVPGT